MDNLTAGNPVAHAVRVYYEGSATIYEGMPVCYNFDTTTNWFGGSVSAGEVTATTTTAEGSQNEGKYIRVEDVATANMNWFAGVIKRGGWCGKTGPRVLDIYVPNGAIVPVRSSVSSTTGVTVLQISNGAYTLGSVAGRPVALAAETVDRSSTNGICLAKLDPNMFLYQASYEAEAGVTNTLQSTFSNTTGTVANLLVHTTIDGAIVGAGSTFGGLFYLNISGSIVGDTFTVYERALLGQLNISGTLNGTNINVAAVSAQLSGTPTLTEVSHVSAILADTQLPAAPTAGSYELISGINNGLGTLNQFMYFYGNTAITPGNGGVKFLMKLDTCQASADELNACVISGGTGNTTLVTGGTWKKIRIDVDGTQYWMVAMTAPAES